MKKAFKKELNNIRFLFLFLSFSSHNSFDFPVPKSIELSQHNQNSYSSRN